MTDFYYGRRIKIDSRLKDEIVKEFAGQSVRYHYEVMNEVWLTGAKLAEQIQFFSTSWLRQNGCYLSRTRATLYDNKENCQNSKWGYSLNGIERAIERGYVQCHGKRYHFNKGNTSFSVQTWWGIS